MLAKPTDTAPLKAQFAQLFGPGGKIHVIRAPGRVNLIGEHTDYNDGFVLPMAIEPHVLVACRGRDDGQVRFASTVFPNQTIEFSVQNKIERAEPRWSNYVRGVAAELLAAGIPLVGMDALISNTLPVGGGLSSSAAILVSCGLAMLTVAGLTMDPSRLALIAQRAEHEYAHVPSGIMDQTIIAAAKAGQAMMLDCRDLSKQYIALDPAELRVVVVNSMTKHENGSGEYAKRRKQCEEGVAFFQKQTPTIKALRDVTMTQLELSKGKLDDVIYRRCRHVISENGRTIDFAMQLTKRNYELAGEQMIASHNSLRDDYEVSSPELDFLVEEAMKQKNVYGARMTGGGFGGCIVALMQPRTAEAFTPAIEASFSKKFGKSPTVFATVPTGGANVLE
ncbi:galactokinase [soil metagenome]